MDILSSLGAAHLTHRAAPESTQNAGPRPTSVPAAPPLRSRNQLEDSPNPATVTADSLSYQRSERTTLYIRTQEGDVVRLMFRSRESGKVDSTHLEDGETELNALELRASSRTALSVMVHGDLNPVELAAIQSTIEQAGALAEEFFAGDLGAAFESASALDIDAEQLARVTLRMKSSERLTYSSYRATGPAAQRVPTHTSPPSVESKASTPEATIAPEEPSVGISRAQAPDAPVEAAAAQPEAAASRLDRTLTLRRIGDYLQRLMAAFDEDQASSSGTESREVLSTSIDLALKLQVFRATLVAASEATMDEQTQLPTLVPETIDALAAQQTPLMAVA